LTVVEGPFLVVLLVAYTVNKKENSILVYNNKKRTKNTEKAQTTTRVVWAAVCLALLLFSLPVNKTF
jgi:hypothetical protein